MLSKVRAQTTHMDKRFCSRDLDLTR